MSIVIRIITYLCMGGICFFFFLLLQRIGSHAEDAGKKATTEIDEILKKRGIMAKYKTTLSKRGVMYRVGNYNLNPSWYICAGLGVGVLVGLLLFLLTNKFVFLFIGIPLGLILMNFYFKTENASDNKDMMMDIYNTYANLKIQLSSGIYMVQSLEYSQKVAQNKRYQEALGELVLNMSDKTVQMERSIEIFRNRFDSREIDKLCALFRNCLAYGASEEYTNDIMGEIQNIILASSLANEHDIETKAGFINFSFFGLIVALTAFTIFQNMSGIEMFF